MFGSNLISTGQKWARAWFKMKAAGNSREKAKPNWTPTPRFHVVNAKYASKHHDTYGVSSTTNKQKVSTDSCLFWTIYL